MNKTERPLAVVTGASKGIGFELARQFVNHGFDLVIASGGPLIEEAARRLRVNGVKVDAVRVDLATEEGCAKLEAAVEATGKPLEAIALNAGVGVSGEFATETNLGEELHLIRLNIVSTVRLAKWATKQMAARNRGRVLITSSIAGLMPTPLEAVYGASKAFVLSLAAALHHELKKTGVTVTAMLPGPTDTEFFHRAGLEDTKAARDAKRNDPAEVARQGYEALMAGKDRVTTGNLSVKLQGAMARFVPEGLKAELHRRWAEHEAAK